MNTVRLVEEYREGVLECVHNGMICVVDKDGIVASAGDPDWLCYYRSASKLIQSLPVIVRKLDQKYGLTAEETAILSGSHAGSPDHVRVVESIMKKTGLKEEQMIMLPTYPYVPVLMEQYIKEGKHPRKVYHNCSGKHLGLMLLARELGEPVEQYWVRDSKTQKEILRVISIMSGCPAEDIRVGIDGCGVPVYAVPFHCIAESYLKLMRPELIEDTVLREAVIRNMEMIHANPTMLSGKEDFTSALNANPDLVGKTGAMGVYAIGIKSMGLGIVYKVMDGSHDEFDIMGIQILREMGYDPKIVDQIAAACHFSDVIINDNKEEVGYKKTVFSLKKH